MKARIIKLLRETNDYISGQQLCDQFHVSRTAIWKVMNQLKEEGYVIESVSNKGYHLIKSPDILTDYELNSIIQTEKIAKNIKYYESIDSTNNEAKRLAEKGEADGTLVIADRQTAGKGRRGRNWSSPEKKDIYMSLLLRPELLPSQASMLTLLTALAVVKGIQQATGLNASIKWPNDIVMNGKKVCGILTEMSSELDAIHYVVIGIGINVNSTEFPNEIKDIASSLAIQKQESIVRSKLVADIMNWMERYYQQFVQEKSLESFINIYNQQLVHYKKEIVIMLKSEKKTAISLGIDKTGELVVELRNGTHERLCSGEISVRGINGYV